MSHQPITDEKSEWVKASVLGAMVENMQGYANPVLNVADEKGLEITTRADEAMSTNPKPDEPESELKPSSDDNGDILDGSDSDKNLAGMNRRTTISRESLLPDKDEEEWWTIAAEVSIPLLIAGFGMVAAGLLLDVVKDWIVFRRVPEFLVLVTPLLGLKGNLEMTLASRLSTHSNLGNMDTFKSQLDISCGNLALTQVQGIVVGSLASIVAIIIGIAQDGLFEVTHALLLCSSSILTASIASFILGLLMVMVVIGSKTFNLNPDNISTPIAASLGDVTTLGLLALISSFLFDVIGALFQPIGRRLQSSSVFIFIVDSAFWVAPSIIFLYIFITPFWILIAYRNPHTQQILYSGWVPVLCAMVLSSGGGLLLDIAEGFYPLMTLLQPVINGVGGNLVSIQASRISTSLHKHSEFGKLPSTDSQTTAPIYLTPWNVFTKQGVHSTSARVLLGLVIPGHLIFSIASFSLSPDTTISDISFKFLLIYISAALIQVTCLLYLAQIFINCFWVRKIDPDTSTIPYLTALGDLLGTGLLFFAFFLLNF